MVRYHMCVTFLKLACSTSYANIAPRMSTFWSDYRGVVNGLEREVLHWALSKGTFDSI